VGVKGIIAFVLVVILLLILTSVLEDQEVTRISGKANSLIIPPNLTPVRKCTPDPLSPIAPVSLRAI